MDYRTGLLMPCERKSVEPIASMVSPARAAAAHHSLLHFVGQSAWSDEAILAKVRELAAPAFCGAGNRRRPDVRRHFRQRRHEGTLAERCEEDRHHFRFTVSPEYVGQMADLRALTRELMADAERDLGTRLGWVEVDHWNTDNPTSTCSSTAEPTTGRTWSSAATTSATAFAVVLESGSRWNWGRAASGRSAIEWRRRSTPCVGPVSIARSAISPTGAVGSLIFAPAASAKIRNFAV